MSMYFFERYDLYGEKILKNSDLDSINFQPDLKNRIKAQVAIRKKLNPKSMPVSSEISKSQEEAENYRDALMDMRYS